MGASAVTFELPVLNATNSRLTMHQRQLRPLASTASV